MRTRAQTTHFTAICVCVAAFFLAFQPSAANSNDASKPSVVKVVKSQAGFQLLRNGEPYFIKGAGGTRYLETLVAAGGNSVRTWRPNHLDALLNRADELGLTVTIGIWLAHERHGFSYEDADAVKRQYEHARGIIRRVKDHPALLIWAVGNEMEGGGENVRVWKAVNDIAKMVKQEDPNHPTMTVIAGAAARKIAAINEHCPDIDIVGINAYGDLSNLPNELKERGLTRPYVLTEFGPFGWWQVRKTSWGEELEPTSSEKADTYRKSYRAAVGSQRGRCFGSYAFLWGDKQEHTRTWFGMFLPEGQRTAAVDAMTYGWTGKWPKNRCPKVKSIRIRHASTASLGAAAHEEIYPPKTQLVCELNTSDPDGDPVRVRWELRSASTDKRQGGDAEIAPPAHPDAIVSAEKHRVVLKLPETPGPYRLFAYAYDEHDHAATINIPILVRASDDDKSSEHPANNARER